MVIAEGGGAAIARSLLETMQNAGVVTRFKLEPFKLTRQDHGIDATPDNLFQTQNGETFVVEVKSSQFLTAERIEKCRQVEAALAGSGMRYLLWTDTSPIPPMLWRLIREMRRLGFSAISQDDIQKVINAISDQPKSVAELREAGIYRNLILCAAWHGVAHFSLNYEFNEKTIISSDVNTREFSRFLTSDVKSHVWWNNLRPSHSYKQIKEIKGRGND
jgi:uncharacterized protein YlzI (FlbEa/FlbD family)